MKTGIYLLRSIGLAALLFVAGPLVHAATTTLVPAGSTWKYLDTGANLGTGWRDPGFDDSAWAAGPAQLGYGDGDEATVVSYGPSSTSKYITTYFRRAFTATDAAGYASLTLQVMRDDGVVVYLNGTEAYRNNLPSGTITSTTLGSTAIGGTDESTFYQASISPALLVEGNNVLSVEIHQSSANSSDISFDLVLQGEIPTMEIALNAPAHGATDVALSPTLDVSVSHRNGLPMTVTFVGRPAPPVGPDFTMVALPDTQFYSSSLNGGSPAIFQAQTDWTVANRSTKNIVFVTQLGDCVQNGDNGGNNVEWRVATNALYRLENPLTTFLEFGIPYGVAVGNHDQSPIGSATGTTTFYNQYFGEAHFSGRPYYGGHYGSNNDDHFELFEASGLKFIVVHFEYDTAMTTSSPELEWADQLLQTYSDRQAIIVSHHIMNSGEGGSFSAQGQAIYNRLRVRPNLFLMLCGHVNPNGEGKRADIYDGRTVHTVLSDYQDRANGGNGWLRTMEFSPANSVIRVRTYSPTLAQFETDSNSQFDLFYDMQSLLGNPYSTLAVNSGVIDGDTTAVWSGLAVSTEYEWYVTASDGTETVTSPVWRFRTADVTLPLAPSGLTAAAQSSSEILLTWTDNADNESGFEIDQSLDGVAFASIGQAGIDVTSALINGLQATTTYHYRVRAFNGAGSSMNSDVASATTLAPPPPPAAPGDLAVVPVSASELALNWTDNSDNEDGFRIERSTDGVSFTEVAVVAPNVAVFSDPGLLALTIYYYRVRAFNAGGASDYSNIASGTTQPPPPPSAPTGLVATGGDRAVTLTWDETPCDTHYYVYRAEVSGGPYNLVDYGVYTPTWRDTVVVPHTTYFYVVRALNDGGSSPDSAEASAFPLALPAAPSGAVISFADVNVLELAWVDNATDEIGYTVERSLDNLSFALVASLPADTTFYWDEGLVENTTYHYRIRAFNADGGSTPAEVSGATTLPPPPPSPAGLTATAVSSSRIDLAWTDTSSTETGFQVERSTDQANWIALAPVLPPNSTSMQDDTVAPGTVYYYRVRSFNSGGASAPSNEAMATTLVDTVASGETTVAATVNGTHANTHANDGVYQQITEISSGGRPNSRYSLLEHQWMFAAPAGQSVTLHLQAHHSASADGDDFVFAYSLDGIAYTDVLTVSTTGDTDTYQTVALPGNLSGTIYVRVRDTDRTAGNTALDTLFVDHLFIRSDVTPVTSPPTVPALQQAVAGDQTVTLSWSSSDGAASYRVYRSETAGSYGSVPHAEVLSGTQFADTVNVVNGTTYFYVVTAVNSFGESAPSNELSATPQASSRPLPPSNLSTAPGKKKNTLTWTQSPSAGVTQNRIYRSTDNQTFQLVTTLAATTSYNDTGLSSGVTYYYYVTALSLGGESDGSNIASGTSR